MNLDLVQLRCEMQRSRVNSREVGMKRVSLLIAILVVIMGAMPLCHARNESDEDGRVTPAPSNKPSQEPTRGPLHEHVPALFSLALPASPPSRRAPTVLQTTTRPPTHSPQQPLSSNFLVQRLEPSHEPTRGPPHEHVHALFSLALPPSPPSPGAPTVLQTTATMPPTHSPQQPLSSSFLAQSLEAFNVVMTIDGVLLPLGESSSRIFKTVTRDSIAGSVVQVLGSSQVHDLGVSISPTSFSKSDNTITFDVLILIRSIIQTHDLKRYILNAFNDHIDTFIYVNTLKATGDIAFRDITTVSIAPSFEINTTTKGTSSDAVSKKRNTTYLVASILSVVVALAAGIGLVSCCVQYRRQQKSLEIKKIRRNETFLTSFTLEEGFASEIEISVCTDMSSLGDLSLVNQYHGGNGGALAFMNGAPTGYNGGCVIVVEEDASILDVATDSLSVHSEPTFSRNENHWHLLAENDAISFPSSNSLPLPSREMDFDIDLGDSFEQQSPYETDTILDIESVTHINQHVNTSPLNVGVFRSTDAEGNVVEYWYA